MKTDIKGSRAIVTGGAQGIGFQLCRQLLKKGAQIVAIFDIKKSVGLESMKKLNNEFGQGRSLFFVTDVTNDNQFKENFAKAVQQLGGLEILINNAGIVNDNKWSDTVDVNIKGVIHGTLLGIDYMGKHKGGKGGTIINAGSIAAFSTVKLVPIYSSTKAAVVTFSRQIGSPYHYDRTGVAVKVMCPGLVNTTMTPDSPSSFLDYIDSEDLVEIKTMPGLKPEELAPEVMKLIEDQSTNAVWVKMVGNPTSSVKFLDFADMLIPLDQKC